MKKRTSASNVMRVVSILGIICLLALQWVWWRNAYRAVEMDMMSKSEECLRVSIEEALMYQLDSTSKGIKVVNTSIGEKVGKVTKFTSHSARNTTELIYILEEGLNYDHRPVTEQRIDINFCRALDEKLGFIPNHTIQICRDSVQIDSISRSRFNRIAIGSGQDTIYQQLGFQAYTIVNIQSPIKLYLKKGAFILAISIILVLLVGSILILQFISMQRDRKFADFIVDYTRMITHDLRTPVSGIQMIFKMFQKNETSQEGIKDKYLVEGEHLTKKILLNLDNILYMAKSEQRELPVHLMEVNVRDFMENAISIYRERDYNPKEVNIETHYEPETFTCSMDVGLMENVVCNLVENAIKFTGMEANITVTCRREKEVVEFRFRDNGLGMSAEDQKRIFELFERGSANKKNQFPGFGIGLHFVERAVKAHGGKVSVQSEVGKGTEFAIRYTS